jgi:hypothetical protein
MKMSVHSTLIYRHNATPIKSELGFIWGWLLWKYKGSAIPRTFLNAVSGGDMSCLKSGFALKIKLTCINIFKYYQTHNAHNTMY